MSNFKNNQGKIIFMVVLALVLQIAAPLAGDLSFADEQKNIEAGETPASEAGKTEEDTGQEEKEAEEDLDEPEEAEDPDEDDSSKTPEKVEIVGAKGILADVFKMSPKGGGTDLGNIFTFESLKINGKEADENQVVTIADGTNVNLDYTWNTVDEGAKAGDYAEIDIPDAFKLGKDFIEANIVLKDETIVGKYSIKNNKLRFEFNENIETADVKNGTLGFGVKFYETKFTEDVVEEIKFNDKGEKTITIIGKPTGEVKSIAKKGLPTVDGKEVENDAKEITWTVDIANPSNTEITDAKLKDKLPEGLELDQSKVKVSNLDIKLDGDLKEGSEITVDGPVVDGQNFELTLPTIAPYKGYRVEYTTKITDNSMLQFTNDAKLTYGETELPAKATVDIKRSAGIEKDGKKVKDKDEIEWSIDVNKNGGSIKEAIVEDRLPVTGELELIPGSIGIFKITKGTDGKWTESESDKTATEFPVNLGKLEAKDIYRIKFKTSIDYTEVNNGAYEEKNNFENKTILKDGTKEIGDAGKTVTVTRKPILAKVGNHDEFSYDKDKKKLTWTVTVNEANHSITNAIVRDTIPAGLKITEGDIVVKDNKGDIVTEGITKTVPDYVESVATNIEIKFPEVITEKYTIEYTTEITDFTKDEFKNAVSLEGTGVGTGGKIPAVPVDPPKNEYTKSFSGINYNEKTMNWTITVDPKREAISKLTITDTFPNKGLILIDDEPNKLEVKKGDQLLIRDTDYTLTSIDDNDNNGFVVEFKKTDKALPINDKITITYTTSYDPEKGIDTHEPSEDDEDKVIYRNKAHFQGKTENENPIDIEKVAEKQVNESTVNSGKKLGKLKSVDSEEKLVDGWHSGNTRKIQWEVYINYLEQNLGKDVSVTDVLGYDGKIDQSSIEVYEYGVAADGTATINFDGKLEKSNYAIVPADNNKRFTLNFEDDFELNKRYAIVFTTSVPDISLGANNYKNTATTKVGDKEYPYTGSIGFDKANNNVSKEALVDGKNVYTDDEVKWNITINEALSIIEKDVKVVDTISKGLVYKNDSLKVYKLKGEERGEALEKGKDYTLKVENITEGENIGETILTIEFADLINSTYEIEYTTVVTEIDGPVNNKVDYSGKNENIASTDKTILNASQFSYVGGEWDPGKGKIIINKVDSTDDSKPITAEAEFEVYYMLNGEKRLVSGENLKTNDGTIEVSNLIIGNTYYIKEVTAPNGFKFDEEKEAKEVDVAKAAGADNSDAYKYDIENTNILTDIKATKAWVDGELLEKPTIELQLYRNDIALEGKVVTLKNEDKATHNWKHTWKGLNLTDNAGKEYTYTVKEEGTPENYINSEDGLTVTNTYVIPKTSVTGTKEWLGGPEEKPSIELQLYKNGKALEGKVVTLKNEDKATHNWKHTWTGLDLTAKDGKKHIYTVDEVETPANYGKSKDGLTVTNTYRSPITDITGRKVWVGGPEEKPNIELQLYKNDVAQGEPVELKDGATSYTWKNLSNTGGYAVKEVGTPENYTKVEDGLTVTNTYKSPKTEITGRKVWVDGPEERPSIELQLYRDGKALDEPVTLKNGTTKYTWTGLDLTDEDAMEYVYTIDEVNIPEYYEKELSEDGLTVTNTYDIKKKPIDPEDPDDPEGSGKPGDPGYEGPIDPNDPGSPEGSGNINDPDDPGSQEDSGKSGLPKTGESSNIVLYLLGGVFILLGIVLRKRTA